MASTAAEYNHLLLTNSPTTVFKTTHPVNNALCAGAIIPCSEVYN